MTTPPETIAAPWTDEQVRNLNKFQLAGIVHPFTCGKRDEHPCNEGILVAGNGGWICPVLSCDYTQNWAHLSMADGSFLAAQEAMLEKLRRGNQA